MKKILFSLLIGASFISQSCINDNEDPVLVVPSTGSRLEPGVGGPTQPNQVWIDLSDIDPVTKMPKQTLTNRTDWDLGFYSGSAFKVVLNSSIMMAATKIPNATNIDAVTETIVSGLINQVTVANFNAANVAYIDDVNGDFPSGYTAIEEIKANDAENGIYLVNMGKEIFTGAVATGAVATGGDSRGWMKIQVTRTSEGGYKVKYAKLNDNVHKEMVITKDASYNYNFVSLKNDKKVSIQPVKKDWDICFTVFTNIIPSIGSYIYPDFVNINNVSGAGAYEILVAAPASGVEAFTNFKVSDIDQSKFVYNDQRVIGGNWRNPVGTNGLEVYGDRFYVIKDPNGFYFKLRFTRLTSTSGERGRPEFEYVPL